jgi:hypothetical protein
MTDSISYTEPSTKRGEAQGGCSVSTGEWFVVCVVRDASDGSTGPQTRKAPLDVGQVVLRVVEGVLE